MWYQSTSYIHSKVKTWKLTPTNQVVISDENTLLQISWCVNEYILELGRSIAITLQNIVSTFFYLMWYFQTAFLNYFQMIYLYNKIHFLRLDFQIPKNSRFDIYRLCYAIILQYTYGYIVFTKLWIDNTVYVKGSKKWYLIDQINC